MDRSDRITILLSVAVLCATIIGTSCSTNARIDDLNNSLNARIDELSDSLNARIDDLNDSLNARIDDLRDSLNARIDAVHARIDAVERDVRELRALVVDALKGGAPPDG